jgi:hypothetical protein
LGQTGRIGHERLYKTIEMIRVAYSLEYIGASYVKGNYQGLYTKSWQAKAGVSGYKTIMNALFLR